MAPEIINKADELIAMLGDLGVAQERGANRMQIDELTQRAFDAHTALVTLLDDAA
ncbi:MAG: hypothetical protein WD208_13000 [Dehalococcoidia bacterium]